MKIKNKASFEVKFEGSKSTSNLKIFKYCMLIIGLLIIVLQTYAYFMQGEDISTGYSYSRLQHSENWMYIGVFMFLVGAGIHFFGEYKKEFSRPDSDHEKEYSKLVSEGKVEDLRKRGC